MRSALTPGGRGRGVAQDGSLEAVRKLLLEAGGARAWDARLAAAAVRAVSRHPRRAPPP